MKELVTVDLKKFLGDQETVDLSHQIFGEDARYACAAYILNQKPEDVFELLADDLCGALGNDLYGFIEAIRRGEEADVGRMIMSAADRCADQLVTSDEVSAGVARFVSKEQTK